MDAELLHPLHLLFVASTFKLTLWHLLQCANKNLPLIFVSNSPKQSVLRLFVCFLGRWVKVTVAVGDESEEAVERQRLATDADILTLEQPGRVTG